MKKLMEQMAEELSAAFEKSGYDPSYGKVTVSNRPDLCEFQCNGAMAGAKAYKKAPFMIADDVVAYLKDSQVFSMAEVVKPGFINLKVKGEFLADYLKEMAADEKLSVSAAKEPKTIIIDYGGPNVAKHLHVGHLRSAIIGESIKRIGRFVGHKVIGDVHLGDWGLQMGLIITELKHRKPELVYFDDSYTGEYPEEAPFTISELEEIYPCASGKSKEDEAYRNEALEATHLLQQGKPGYMALWNHIMNVSVTDLKRNYDKLNVSFDLWKKESDAQPYIPGMVEEMKEKGYLIRTDRGFRIVMDFQGNTVHYDATNPAAREYVWQKAKKNYYDKGIKVFWLDEAEPEYSVYDFDNYRYHMGPNVQVGNIYPALYAKTFFDGMKAEGQENIINLLRCAWAGSQKYGALVWSGDIHSSFSSLRNQLAAGLNMGLAGIPWWTTDIGGFHGGDPKDPKFQELLVRWFEYGTFCPVMRLHGYREPLKEPMGKEGGAACVSGADNEVWSFGEEAYEICKKYLALRESMKPYITELMEAAHEKGTPVMRPLFYDFPKDSKCWEIEDQYMFGPDVLVAPVTYADMRKRTIYLPEGSQWTNFDTEEIYEGGQVIEVDAPLSQIPVFTRNGRKLK